MEQRACVDLVSLWNDQLIYTHWREKINFYTDIIYILYYI